MKNGYSTRISGIDEITVRVSDREVDEALAWTNKSRRKHGMEDKLLDPDDEEDRKNVAESMAFKRFADGIGFLGSPECDTGIVRQVF